MKLATTSEEVLGSVVEIKLPEHHSDFFQLCFGEMRRIENEYSRFLNDSALSRMNKNLGIWHDTSKEMIWLLEQATMFYEKTEHNFDITLKSVLDQIGYDGEYSFSEKTASAQAQMEDVLGLGVEIDRKAMKARLVKQIDFGGFGKGFALDRVASMLERNHVDHYYLNAGGDIYAKSADGEMPWAVLLEHPDDATMAIGKIELNGGAIACSSSNRRRWGREMQFHHLINAKTKQPATGVKAIFVTAKRGLDADAYATALFTAGFDESIALSQQLPIEILTVSNQNKMYKSEGFEVEFFNGTG